MTTAQLPTRPRRSLRTALVRRGAAATAADAPAPLVDHLVELRRRVLVVGATFLVAFAVCYWQIDRLFDWLSAPLDDRWPVQTLGVTEPFFTSLSVAAQASFVVVTPVLAWQVWRFVRPAVNPDARRTIGALLLVAPMLFTSGVAFCYFLVLGPAVRVLLGLGPSDLEVVVRASDYYSFVTMTLLAVGAAFCFPLVLLGLARIGLITAERLRSHRKFALVGLVVLAALLPTVDPVSLAIEVVPLIALYELSIVAVRVQERRLAKRDAALAAADASVPDHA